VASSRDRQRKLARAKLDRQLARRAARVRRRRQMQAGVGAAVALLLIVFGAVWLAGGFDSKPKQDAAAQDLCTWTTQDAGSNPSLKDVGTPPTKGMPTSGTRPMTITTSLGAPIGVTLDLAKAPCSGASLAYLAGKNFYDNTTCTEITAEGALHCGDPGGTGLGGPTYTVYSENVPTRPSGAAKGTPAVYPKGTVALTSEPPGQNGSQFLVFFKDFTPKGDPQYPIVGRVTSGLDTLAKIAAVPTVDNGKGAKVKPRTDIVLTSVTVGEPVAASATAAATAAPTSSNPS
jgi:peptidyl-prolyl cis-trans isomerase B (cyclophilin B)